SRARRSQNRLTCRPPARTSASRSPSMRMPPDSRMQHERQHAMEISELMAPRVLGGRIALVTGAGQGNGKAIAQGLAKAGARVVVTDLNEGNAQAVAAHIRSEGGEAVAYRLDVTSQDACQALAAAVAAEVGDIDIL